MEKTLIVEGEMIHRVGYRPFLLVEALKRKKITNFEADNLKTDNFGNQKVVVNIIGEEQKILEFVDFVKNNFPDYARNCRVTEEKDSCPSEVMYINDFRDILAVEQQNNMVQGGLLISNKIDTLRTETNDNFDKIDKNFEKMDAKYKLISEGMFAIVNELKETNKVLGEKLEKTEKNIEKTDKNIEKLLRLLVQQKK